MHDLENHLAEKLRGLLREARVDDGEPPLARLVVGLSGGADSVALLRATLAVNQTLRFAKTVVALHVDHQIHEQSGSWAEFCVSMCARLSVELITRSVNVARQGNLEAAARDARYAAFTEVLTDQDLLLLAQHAQDQTETVLLRLLQGRGVLPMRDFGRIGASKFLRPLLALGPLALRDYLEFLGQTWIEDPSNAETRFDRNYLRREVLPKVVERWPKTDQAVARVTAYQAGERALLDIWLSQLQFPLSVAALPEADLPAQILLRRLLQAEGFGAISDPALAEFLRQVRQASLAELRMRGGVSLRLWRRHLYLVGADEAAGWHLAGMPTLQLHETFVAAGFEIRLEQTEAANPTAFVYPGPLHIRPRRGGEVIELNGATKGPTSVKDLLVRSAVPPWQRSSYPLLYHGRALCCVPGIAVAKAYQEAASEDPAGLWCQAAILTKGAR